MRFEPNATYTRKQIAEGLGGIGPGILPAKAGKPVAGLFDPASNAITHLSGEIDVFPKTLPKAAKAGGGAIPVFLKISTHLWRYVGEYKLEEIDQGKRALKEHEGAAAVLRLKPVKPPLKLIQSKRAPSSSPE